MNAAQAALAPAAGPPAAVPGRLRPRRLWSMYVLVMLALPVMGGGVAQVWVAAHDTSVTRAANACLARHGIPVPDTHMGFFAMARLTQTVKSCDAPLSHAQGIAMLAGAAVLPAAAWLLMLAGDLGMRWRLRHSALAQTVEGQAAARRFGAWCDAAGLAGRRRPRLLLAAPGRLTAEAFTTGLPFGRPLVVVPAACAYANPAAFDVIVLHELAHVRARDLTWASSVWWAGWLSLPALLLAVSPDLTQPLRLLADNRPSLWLAAAVSAALLVLRASALRRRELAADRFAAAALGGTAALAAAVRPPAGPGPGRLRAAAAAGRSLAATHPAPAARIRAATADLHRGDGGFAATAAASALAMFTFQGLSMVLDDLLGAGTVDAGLPADLTLTVPCLLWAWMIVPAWARRAAAAARAGSPAAWTGPLAGAVLGLAAGYCLQIPGTFSAIGMVLLAGHRPLLVTTLAAVTAGAVTLAAGAAAAAGTRTGGRALALPGAVIASGLALSAAVGAMNDVLAIHAILGSPAVDRMSLLGEGATTLWGNIVLVAAGLAAVSLPAAGRPRDSTRHPAWPPSLARAARRVPLHGNWAVSCAAAAAGGAAAVLSWQLRYRPGVSQDTLDTWIDQRFWICALAGWAAAAVILITSRDSSPPGSRQSGMPAARVPAALTAGLSATVLAALAVVCASWATGFRHDRLVIEFTLEVSVWLLFVTTIATLPWVLLAAAAANRIRRRHRPVPRLLPAALSAGLAVGAVSLAVLTGILAPITVTAHDQQLSTDALRPANTGTGPASPARPATPADP